MAWGTLIVLAVVVIAVLWVIQLVRFNQTPGYVAELQPIAGVTSSASGYFAMTKISPRAYAWVMSLDNITNANAAHLHYSSNKQIAYSLNGFSPITGTSAHSVFQGTITFSTDADEALLKSQGYYVNVHTVAYPNGEIQGTIID